MKGRIHFIGVQGVGVNALAKFSLDAGFEVSGSDARPFELARSLEARGADIWQGSDISRLEGVDIAVYSSAVKRDDAELKYLLKRGVPCFERHEFLHNVSKLFEKVYAISGTHGKTTTTAMLAHILKERRVVAFIGGESVEFSNYLSRADMKNASLTLENLLFPKKIFDGALVVEACEYKRSFLDLEPTVGVALNAECDHPDCYSDIDEVYAAFKQFLYLSKTKILPNSLTHLLEKDDRERIEKYLNAQLAKYLEAGINCKDIVIALSDALASYGVSEDGDVLKDGELIGRLKLSDSSAYNLKNALFAIAVAEKEGVDSFESISSLSCFSGVKRRFESAGEIGGAKVYFDFAHHPTEIASVLLRARKLGRVLTVFQPHTFSRLKAYMDDFAYVLSGEGAVIIMPVYGARETSDAGETSLSLRNAIFDKYRKTDVYLTRSDDETLYFVKMFANDYDVILFVGAGDIYDLKKKL